MRRQLSAALWVAAVLAVSACKEAEAPKGVDTVSEVLPGSASDAMIPYGTLRSQRPIATDAPKAEATGAPARKGAAAPASQPNGATTATAPVPEPASPAQAEPPAPSATGAD